MGERWKAMSDKDKRPYFEAAKKYALEHKKVSQRALLFGRRGDDRSRPFATALRTRADLCLAAKKQPKWLRSPLVVFQQVVILAFVGLDRV